MHSNFRIFCIHRFQRENNEFCEKLLHTEWNRTHFWLIDYNHMSMPLEQKEMGEEKRILQWDLWFITHVPCMQISQPEKQKANLFTFQNILTLIDSVRKTVVFKRSMNKLHNFRFIGDFPYFEAQEDDGSLLNGMIFT